MATIVNERDVLLQGAANRVVDVDAPKNVTPPALKGISIEAPANSFLIDTGGSPSPASITINATLRGIDAGTVIAWSVISGTATLSGGGASRTLAYSAMSSTYVTVQASVTVGGLTYTDALSFFKIQSGTAGAPGQRGALAVARAITGTAWSDTEAAQALTDAGASGAISTDTCTLYNSAANYAEMRRYNGTSWMVVGESVPGSVLMRQTVSTEKLLVVGQGTALNSDPNTQDVTAWSGSSISVVSDTTAPNGATALRCAGTGTTVVSRRFAINENSNYRVRTWAKQESGTSTVYLVVAFYDASGALLDGSTYPANWTNRGTYHYYGLYGSTMPGSWTQYSADFGPDETFHIPSGARFAAIGLISNYNAAGVQRISGLTCFLKTSGEMIVDGAVTANKINSRELTIRNKDGAVLLDASGDAVPPWITDLSSNTSVGTGLLKPVTGTNTRQLRSLKVGSGLSAVVTDSGDCLTISSTNKDIISITGDPITSTDPSNVLPIAPAVAAGDGEEIEVLAVFQCEGNVNVSVNMTHTSLTAGGMLVMEEWPTPGVLGSLYKSLYGSSNYSVTRTLTVGSATSTPMVDPTFGSSYHVHVLRLRLLCRAGLQAGVRVDFAAASTVDASLLWSRVTRIRGRETLTIGAGVITSLAVTGTHNGTATFLCLPGGHRALAYEITFFPNGTYEARAYSYTPAAEGVQAITTLAFTSGNWSSNPGTVSGVGPGNDAQIQFEVVNTSGFPQTTGSGTTSVTNDAVSLTSLSVARTIKLAVIATNPSSALHSAQVKINLIKVGGSSPQYVDSPTINLHVGA